MFRLVKNALRYHTFSRYFWIGTVLLLYNSLWYAVQNMEQWSVDIIMDNLPIVCGVIILNTAREKSSGGYRNILAAGYTRTQFFFSRVITSAVCSAVLYLIVSTPLLYAYAPKHVLFYTAAFMMIFVFAGVVITCAILCFKNTLHAIALVAALGLTLYVTADPLRNAVREPRYDFDKVSVVRDDFTDEELELLKNRDYVGGLPRAFLIALAYTHPYVQADTIFWFMLVVEDGGDPMLLAYFDPDMFPYDQVREDFDYMVYKTYWLIPLSSLGVITIISIGCCLVFRRKDLN